MSRKNRLPKTQIRKLQDLEDHLHFLKEAMAKLAAGDEAYLKQLATELRVLVCESSRTEGLLWRMIDELQATDIVHIFLPGNFDREHPVTQGMRFGYALITRSPHNDSANYSLRDIIKQSEAFMISHISYTHEKLIRAVAEQMGSAHEDEGAEPYLVEINSVVSSQKPVLVSILMTDAEMVVEVGEKTLAEAVLKCGFVKRMRAPIIIEGPYQSTNTMPTHRSRDFESPSIPMGSEGTVVYVPTHAHSDWRINSSNYYFGPIIYGELSLRIQKHPDKTVCVYIEGLSDSVILLRGKMPTIDNPNMGILITWGEKIVTLFVGGGKFDSVTYQPKF